MNPFDIRDTVKAQDILDMSMEEACTIEVNFYEALDKYHR